MMRWLYVLFAMSMVVGCDKPVTQEIPTKPLGKNLLVNGGFEEGAEPWFSLESKVWGPAFEWRNDHAASGSHSASLFASSFDGPDKRTHICGVVQEVELEPGASLPKRIGGKYFVKQWQAGTPDLYVQFVVIVFDMSNPPRGLEHATNFQLRYPLAGLDKPAFNIGNAQWVFVNKAEPIVGQWIEFERDLREDFLRYWGRIPRDFAKIRVLYEVRWDNRRPNHGPTNAEVFFDDLYLGE